MKSFFRTIQAAVLFLLFPFISFANGPISHPESVDVHDEAINVAAIDPIFIIGVIGVVLIGGFIIWKFFLRKK